MNRIIIILAVFAFTSSIAIAQSAFSIPVVSPGIRLGYSPGDAGGFTLGVELSAGYWNRTMPDAYGGSFLGGVISYDYGFNGRGKLHLGAEGTFGPVGVEAGPTLLFEKGTIAVAPTLTAFGGLVVMPFYSVTFPGDRGAISEWGAFVKYPIRTDGGELVGL